MQQQSVDPVVVIALFLLVASFLLTGCDTESSGANLYTLNCASCHGVAGKGGSAIALSDAAYLATHDELVMARLTSDGVPSTTMRAFGKSRGGSLTDDQITTIVRYLRSNRSAN